MAMVDVTRQRRSLLEDATALHHLPPDLLDIIRDYHATNFLDAVALAALSPPLTERIFMHFEPLFPDICARWILHAKTTPQLVDTASALARLLPFASYLAVFLQSPASGLDVLSAQETPRLHLTIPALEDILALNNDDISLKCLITLWRLLNFNFRLFSASVSPVLVQQLFKHENRAIRYLAIRLFCLLLRASDHKLELLIEAHLGSDAINGELDGKLVDLGFLSLLEHQRVKLSLDLRKAISEHAIEQSESQINTASLTPYVISYGDALLPRPSGPAAAVEESGGLVLTSTTINNLQSLARMLRNPDPILLHGSPGVGKTALIHEVAKQLGMYDSMVTLHLNEQTDAKMLIGLYSTDSKPGSFQWRPGVLTTAVREGRWVLVEDLDRAPTEVLSTLLPLIERNELLIPSRGETIRAADSFRLFATVRTSRGLNGRENLPSLVGMRFWQAMPTEQLTEAELETVVLQTYPVLKKFITGILAVHTRLAQLTKSPLTTGRGRSFMDRQITLRDLLKWCRRLQECLLSAGSKTGDEPITETTRDWMFMEAVDCFVGSCPDVEVSNQLVYAIAEEMHLSKERADHYVTSNIPPLEDSESQIRIGRVHLQKRPARDRVAKSKRPFASTVHAKRLLEQIAVAVKLSEPVLLVGETGIGKTTVVQQLAETLGNKLIAVNLSQQSEVGDLLGGFKPVNVRALAVPLKEEFEDLFAATGISASKNQKYIEQIGKCMAKGQWTKLSKLWNEAPKMFTKILAELEKRQGQQESPDRTEDDGQPVKRRKTESRLQSLIDLQPRWQQFANSLEQFELQVSAGPGTFAFSFMEGNLIKAVRNGYWVLLDEINLASPDTLESIADLLTGPTERPSILLSETGEIEKIVAHPNFRIFGAMNPATDIGKRDLPVGIRSRFTELYVRSPDTDIKDLLTIIKTYLGSTSNKNDQAADDIGRLYLNTKRLAEEKQIVDGANEVPHFSLRTLTRVLTYVNTISPFYGIRRALYEGFAMGFLTLLERQSEKMLMPLIYHHLLDKHGNVQSLLSQPPKHPSDGKRYVKFQNQARDRQYWLFQGNEPTVERDDYVITPYVERNLLNVVRATSTRKFPILIQGPTSAGKTSMIEYLANFTGNKFVRINNHEHTDLQEYLGTYVSGQDGKLRFQEGVLVQAMRQGHWIVLDELNLAPTDVLEALNRLLDDNRELLIPETQEVVKPHENFILFATQNPPGLYGGRKVLSRAFRNRFLELHFDDIPEDELEYILQQRSRNTSPPDCRRIVAVYKELSRLRQTSRVFEQKDSFATLRDLFRWALREAETREEIACHGFMLLAERVRNEEERQAVKEIIEKVFKVKIDLTELYSPQNAPELKQIMKLNNSQGVVWTLAMRRLYVLVSRALRNNEPVLLVGETGCGKTTVCQLLAEAVEKQLHIVNAHQNTETGDLIGSQRPVRNRGAILDALNEDLRTALEALGADATGSIDEKIALYGSLAATETLPHELKERIKSTLTRSKALFEWSDGALVEAMRDGSFFLLDEISLADDSVLERLNSVLEPGRTLLLAEKGTDDSFIRACSGFQFFATMNPGGDFGKKELSPALRNRFTEIWVPQLSGDEDIFQIVKTKLTPRAKAYTDTIVKFANWFGQTFRPMATTPFSVREILVWVHFLNSAAMDEDLNVALIHGASAIFIDSIGANPSALLASDMQTINQQRQQCFQRLGELMDMDALSIFDTKPELILNSDSFSIGSFSVPRDASAGSSSSTMSEFAFHAPTTRLNVMRVVRALQMKKPILLEGSPGVGKTSLVTALAQACGRPLTRINLSDQTDLMDLFGTDVPVEGEAAGNFAWRDAPFLQAMQKGEWVLLDEMNLASQSVLEGLNACLDHRGEVYVSELDQVFKRHPDFCLFAAQNPHHQGGGRKGLPASFVNRFIVVYADIFTDEDLQLIANHNFPNLPTEVVTHLIQFISAIDRELLVDKSFGAQGSPWEFNLRDVLRWLHLLNSSDPVLHASQVDDFLDIVIRQRFRTESDRAQVDKLFATVFGTSPRSHHLYHDINATSSQVGLSVLARNLTSQPEKLPCIDVVPRLAELESLMICIKQNIPCILTAQSGYGKSAMLEYVAAISGRPLVVFPMNADVDTMDLVGGFEQADPLREANAAIKDMQSFLQQSIMSVVPSTLPEEVLLLLRELDTFGGSTDDVQSLNRSVHTLLETVPSNSEVGTRLVYLRNLLDKPLSLEAPRFEWLDGIIIKALEAGQWLVLDNANLCNASVLDRLNSLLEPNGFLSVNEHCGPGGEPRMVYPHPDFRIFLTVDPKYGELSRAMRNRAIEINLCDSPPLVERPFEKVSPIEGSLQRYYAAVRYDSESISSVKNGGVALELLSLKDLSLLARFAAQSSQSFPESSVEVARMLAFLQSTTGSNAREATAHLYTQLGSTELPVGISQSQPIHTLVNYSISQLAANPDAAIQAAVVMETCVAMHQFQTSIERYQSSARTSKLSSLTRLERSLISDRVAAVSKDSTVGLYKFLSSTLGLIQGYLTEASSQDWRLQSYALHLIWNYLNRTIELASTSNFEEAVFQAHLSQGTNMLTKIIGNTDSNVSLTFLSTVLNKLNQDFTSGFKLSTGLSMEQLWTHFRPIPIADRNVLDRSMELDRLTQRFDELKWKTDASLSDLAKAQKILEQACSIVRSDAESVDELVQDLVKEVVSLESNIGDENVETKPFFYKEFERLRQINMLQSSVSMTETNYEISVLSNIPSRARMMLASSTSSSLLLQYISCLGYSNTYAWDGKLMTSLWEHLSKLDSVPLNGLALLGSELPLLGKQITTKIPDITTRYPLQLNELLKKLLLEVFAVHSSTPAASDSATAMLLNMDSYQAVVESESGGASVFDFPSPSLELGNTLQSLEPSHFRQITLDHFMPAILGINRAKSSVQQHSALHAGLAWIHASIGLVKLYIPDRIIDPQLRPKMEREFLEQMQSILDQNIASLQDFETNFSGQNINMRIKILLEEKTMIGPLPDEVQPVYRPEQSQLNQLHAEFANILKAITDPLTMSMLEASFTQHSDEESGLSLLKENIDRLFDRLLARFEAYQDITRPAANLMRCFLIGLSLCYAGSSASLPTATDSLLKTVPFAAGSVQYMLKMVPADKTFEYLDAISAKVAVETLTGLSASVRQGVFECFHSFFDDWNKRLESDRKAEEARTSLFKFRGSFEDEEELDSQEFNELFPTYDDDDEEQTAAAAVTSTKNKEEVREASLRVAKIHKEIFLEKQNPTQALKTLSLSTNGRAVKEMEKERFISPDISHMTLPSTMILFNEKRQRFESPVTSKNYNFYTDANIVEARSLVSLARSIKSKFRELQQVDEIGHMQPLIDVIDGCDKLLELIHAEPLAKILPKLEQLHGHVYEWQFGGWASAKYGVLELHNSVTDTLIKWRRLELSTWANLFDMEQTKCRDDASSWWFIAYQVVIAVPLTLLDALDELDEYAQSLTKNLEVYFTTSIVGQFRGRIELLKQLAVHLQWLVQDYPALNVIHRALSNFIAYFSRYEAVADAAINDGRAPIDKKMKDVLLVASWKDTNITALRESARKSHMKLFRLVRKFRGVLGQEMKIIIARGLPEVIVPGVQPSSYSPVEIQVSPQTVAVIKETMPDWINQHKRIANIATTTGVMTKIANSNELTNIATDIVESFISNLESAMIELRKETPPHLTEENKTEVKHLKTRKRKLFAETLRELRNMGLRFNLSQDPLAEQDSLSTILTSDGIVSYNELELGSISAAEYFFHKTIDLAPKARDSAREHSEDLTSAEVARSIGFVEGAIYFTRTQRCKLEATLDDFSMLGSAIRKLTGLSSSNRIKTLSPASNTTNWTNVLPWTIEVLKYAVVLVDTHAKLSSENHIDVIEQIRAWTSTFEGLLTQLKALPKLPSGISSDAHIELEKSFSDQTASLRNDLQVWVKNSPNLCLIIEHIASWTTVESSSIPSNTAIAKTDLAVLSSSIATLCDAILVAVESAKNKASELPQNDEEPGWLQKYNDGWFSMLKQLHMKEIASRIDHCFDLIRGLNLSSVRAGTLVGHLVAMVHPILEHFDAFCKHSIQGALELYRSTTHMGYIITRAYSQISSQGFCSPKEKSDETSGETGELESGTGLGEGDGAEDISKDIQPDEDLTELAQEANKEDTGEIEDEKDAVDMADEELEGDMGSVDGKDEEDDDNKDKNEDEEEEEDNDMDEEAGDVDDLDPTAVDEKMWDGDDEKAEKDQQGEKADGKKDEDQTAPDDENAKQENGQNNNDKEDPNQPEDGEDEGEEEEEDEEEGVEAQEELNKQDQTVEEKDKLELPEDMDLDLKDQESLSSDSEDDIDAMSDIEGEELDPKNEEVDDGAEDEEDIQAKEENPDEEEQSDEEDKGEEDDEMGTGEKDEIDSNPAEEEELDKDEAEEDDDQPEEAPPTDEDTKADLENAAPSDVKSSGQDQKNESMDLDEQFQANAMEQNEGDTGDGAVDEETSVGNKGATSKSEKQMDMDQQDAEYSKAKEADPFKKLGDALEKWHRQQADIKAAKQEDESAEKSSKEEANEQEQREFQHLKDDQDAEDTQAMGTADNEEVQPMDDAMAIDEEKKDPASRVMDGDEDEPEGEADDDIEPEDAPDSADANERDNDDARTGVKTRQGNYNRDPTPENDAVKNEDEDESLQDASAQLSLTHISDLDRPLRDFGECMDEWSEFQSKSHRHSLSLTSQLRLILTPSQSTKLSGSFRTGKRLNIKRIIPYIASSYKRDKIWMRRAVPTKRTYQILLCVDDSKSMGESSSGTLAMESLVMVSRSLTMLEAGQIGVLGFGREVFNAHQLTDPFSADSGAKVLQKFTFSQDRTDIVQLIRQTIDTFRIARQQSSGGADLWQLALILSDGLTPSSAHDPIRRLLREAMEERIMIVFIIMDDRSKQQGDSVLELKEAKFVNENGESRVVIERYLDTFPFQYYLIVHNLEELPGALAGLLRTWFAEVNS